jgi:hypothetical protein
LQQVTTLHKQNFDLKLELFHRRQRQEALEARLEAAEKQLAEQAELQEVNEQLLAELEKRDIAVEEAVCMIVSLEDKVEKLMQDRENVRAFEADYEPGYFRDSLDGPPSSPPQLEERRQTGMARMPSFLSETTEGAEVLRSLYLPNNHSYSDATLPKLLEDETNDGMNSPRLSVLSESSFISVYGDKHKALDEPDDQIRRHRASSSVEKWMDDRPAPIVTPKRPSPPVRKSQFRSINDVLESPLQRLEKLKHTLEKSNRGLQAPPERSSVEDKTQPQELRRQFTTEKANFESQHPLPPTPDTVGTHTLRNYQNSNDTLADNKNGTFLNATPTFAVPPATFNAFQSTLSIRPRSAGETVTSRREGHGWDTASRDETVETGSFDESITTFASQRYARPSRGMTPNLFSFTDGGWGKEVMYDHEASLFAHGASRYSALRRSSLVETPLSDQTIIEYSPPPADNTQYSTTPIDTTPQPNLPDRRSSLTATTKLRKSNNTSIGTSSQVVTTSSPLPPKKSRMSSLRLFGRSETTQVPPAQPSPSQATSRPRGQNGRSQTYADDNSFRFADDEGERATPPPIQRNRPSAPVHRPSSAGQGASRRISELSISQEISPHRRRDSVGVKNEVGVNQREVEDDGIKGSGGRKWFGIGVGGARNSNLRRT